MVGIGKRGRIRDHLRKVTTIDARTGQIVTQVRRDDDRGADAIAPPAPVFFPDPATRLDHWSLPLDLRLARREAHVGALRTWLESVELVATCRCDDLVPLIDLVCAAADACSAAIAQWGVDRAGLVDLMTGGGDESQTPRIDFAMYAARKHERDLWQQRLIDLVGPLERDRAREIARLDDGEIWELLMQVDYALSCYAEITGGILESEK